MTILDNQLAFMIEQIINARPKRDKTRLVKSKRKARWRTEKNICVSVMQENIEQHTEKIMCLVSRNVTTQSMA